MLPGDSEDRTRDVSHLKREKKLKNLFFLSIFSPLPPLFLEFEEIVPSLVVARCHVFFGKAANLQQRLLNSSPLSIRFIRSFALALSAVTNATTTGRMQMGHDSDFHR